VRETPGAHSTVFVMLYEYLLGKVPLSKHHGGRPVFGRERMLCSDVNSH
jgi:hypothetical protein